MFDFLHRWVNLSGQEPRSRAMRAPGAWRGSCAGKRTKPKFAAGGLLTKFIKRGLEASQCAQLVAVGRYTEAAKQKSNTAEDGWMGGRIV